MSPAVKYTLARLGLFAAVFAAAWFVPGISVLVKLMIAIVVSAAAGWFLLRNLRDEVSAQVEGAVDRRREQKEQLRAALAGETADAGAETEKSHS
ncbi:DUF4229 domain-containing protein [Catellatospora sp. KI3]|uniref:DUF4229 domain-containing protein n=1 Tax=Catellatospora sp. KI3 TaxID=3041620 RepID=UPI0024822FE4|nr:DUF4229 domain-containing protein [Catellatospora sp. KI3]MDI1461870.1 DUF4229 domain-containing protein [Catellatospora sp. KI3]